VALKKSDLYSSLWSSADELRGSMDASQYKDYVLTLLFVKYVSDKAKADKSSLIYVPDDGSFDYLVSLKGKPDVGEKVNIAVRRLAEENDLLGVINNANFDEPAKLGSGKELQDKVSNLIGIFQDMDFTGSNAEGDDLLGDAYEYLMRHFATQSGKSKGQFYTPAEVSRVMAQLLQIPAETPKSATVYDPTCGSGSLLIKVADAAPNGLTIYGQENDNATWALARMNMILHGNETHDLRQGNTLADPKFTYNGNLQTFDYLVANPPFSVKTWRNGYDFSFGRFDGFDTPPDKNGDYAFLLHMVKSLRPRGKGVVVLPHGVLFRGNSEARIRTELIKRGYIKAIIGLPANLFYGTGIPACLIVLDKEDAQARTGIFMIDASKGFAKEGPKNRLRPRDMHKIVDAFTGGREIPRYSRMVPLSEISSPENDYNLNVPRYIDSSEPDDVQDVHAHVNGGIPNRDLDALQSYWDAFPNLRSELFTPLRESYSELKVDPGQVQHAVIGFEEYLSFAREAATTVDTWWEAKRGLLTSVQPMTIPSKLSHTISEALLEAFRASPLLDEYGVYEQLMAYWNDVMHDDVSLISAEGWTAAVQPREARTWKDKNNKARYEDSHVVFGTGGRAKRWVMDVLPPDYVIARYYAAEQAELDRLTEEREANSLAIGAYLEDHVVEGGLLFDAADDDGKLTAGAAKAAIKELTAAAGDPDEVAALARVIALYAAETKTKAAVNDATVTLNMKAIAKYKTLTEREVQKLVIDDKWGATLQGRINGEVTALGQVLISRLSVLGERYRATVAQLEGLLEGLSAQVDSHLESLGAAEISSKSIVRLGEVGSTFGGLTGKTKADFGRGNAKYVTFVEVMGSARLRGLSLDKVNTKKGERQAEVRRGDVLFNGSSETPEEVALGAYVDFDVPPRVHLNSFCFGYRISKPGVVDPRFLAYFFRSGEGRRVVSSLAQGATRYNISKTKLLELPLMLPSYSEQCSIAQALTDCDDLIESSLRQIAKKRDVKQGLMQELLTRNIRFAVEEQA
jgi:type I restriction enzyme M protein